MLGKKIVGKKCENTFLYSHEYRDQIMEGKECAKQFFKKHNNSASKKCLAKIVAKKCEKTFFYIITRISCPKNGGGKRA